MFVKEYGLNDPIHPPTMQVENHLRAACHPHPPRLQVQVLRLVLKATPTVAVLVVLMVPWITDSGAGIYDLGAQIIDSGAGFK